MAIHSNDNCSDTSNHSYKRIFKGISNEREKQQQQQKEQRFLCHDTQ